MRSVAPTLNEALAIVERLPLSEQAQLVAQIAPRIAQALANEAPAVLRATHGLPFPIISEGQWSDAVPTNRDELYDDDERC